MHIHCIILHVHGTYDTAGMCIIIHQYTSTSCMQHVYIVTAGMYIIIHQYTSTCTSCTQHVYIVTAGMYIIIHQYTCTLYNFTYMYCTYMYCTAGIYIIIIIHKCTYCTCIIQLDVHVHNTLYIKNMYMNGTMYKTATCK